MRRDVGLVRVAQCSEHRQLNPGFGPPTTTNFLLFCFDLNIRHVYWEFTAIIACVYIIVCIQKARRSRSLETSSTLTLFGEYALFCPCYWLWQPNHWPLHLATQTAFWELHRPHWNPFWASFPWRIAADIPVEWFINLEGSWGVVHELWLDGETLKGHKSRWGNSNLKASSLK